MARFAKTDIVSLVGASPRYDLGESVGSDLRLGEVLDPSLSGDLGDLGLGYGSAQGDPRLRALIADAHGVSGDDVVVTVGGMHALFLVAFTLCDRGDEAVTASPMFPLARNVLETVGANVRTVSLTFDRGYRLDPDEIAHHLSSRTRLVSLAFPQNPSGVACPPDDVRAIVAAIERRSPRAYLLLDETYREAVYGDDVVAPSAAGWSERIVSCASLSKCHGAPGLRLGWAIARDPGLREELVIAKFNTVISCSSLDEAVALRVLRDRDRIIGERRKRLAEGLARTKTWVREHEGFVEWVRPDAGALCCVRLRPSRFDDDAVGRFYTGLAREGVRVASGTWFGDDARVFRLGFGRLTTSDLEIALGHLSAALRRAGREAA
jgi:aspartate/methionine/tyrosine aminotransferase